MADLWAQLGSPLRPCAEDQIGYSKFIDHWIQQYQRPRILILGVTPELYHLGWPAKCDLMAIDRAREMIEQVWPGGKDQVVEADWLEMPLPQRSRDLALCDGGMILVEHPKGHRKLKEQLRHLLDTDGRCIFRLFVPPRDREKVETVLNSLIAGRIPNLNVLKLRIGMALQDSAEEGVSVQEIRRTVLGLEPNLERLAEHLGWSLDHLRVIDTYRDSPARYYFASERQIADLFCAENEFSIVGRWNGSYPLAERCPIIAFRRH